MKLIEIKKKKGGHGEIKEEISLGSLPVFKRKIKFIYKNGGRCRRNSYFLFGIWCGQHTSEDNAKTIIKADANKPKAVIYTCITGKYDGLIEHACVNENYDYVCFTDNSDWLKQGKIHHWQIRPLVFDKSDKTRNARWHKTHPHILFPEYEYSVWMDGNVDVFSEEVFRRFAALFKDEAVFAVCQHPLRSCIYDESREVLRLKKETGEETDRIISFLQQQKFPHFAGLHETSCLFRRHNDPQCQNIMNEWWELIEKYSKRDQLSLDYVLWKNKFMAAVLFNPQEWRNFEMICPVYSHKAV